MLSSSTVVDTSFPDSNFCLEAQILSLAINTISCFSLKWQAPFVHFEKMPAKYPVWKSILCHLAFQARGEKRCCMREKKKKVVSSTHKLSSLEITITHWNAAKVVYAYWPFYYTECFENHQYLVRFIIFTASSRDVLKWNWHLFLWQVCGEDDCYSLGPVWFTLKR